MADTKFNDKYFPRVDLSKCEYYKYDKREFAYDKDRAIVYLLFKDPEEVEEMGKDAPYRELDGVGLSRENWKNKEVRDEYLFEWTMDLDDEEDYMVQDFIQNELPYYQNKKSESLEYPRRKIDNIYIDDIYIDDVLDYMYGTDRDKNNFEYTDSEIRRAIDYYEKKHNPSPYEESLQLRESTDGLSNDPEFDEYWGNYPNDPLYDNSDESRDDTIDDIDINDYDPGSEENNDELEPLLEVDNTIYIDTNGIMGVAGDTWTERELMNYWDTEQMNDPILSEYSDYESWREDTISQMEEVFDDEIITEDYNIDFNNIDDIDDYEEQINDVMNDLPTIYRMFKERTLAPWVSYRIVDISNQGKVPTFVDTLKKMPLIKSKNAKVTMTPYDDEWVINIRWKESSTLDESFNVTTLGDIMEGGVNNIEDSDMDEWIRVGKKLQKYLGVKYEDIIAVQDYEFCPSDATEKLKMVECPECGVKYAYEKLRNGICMMYFASEDDANKFKNSVEDSEYINESKYRADYVNSVDGSSYTIVDADNESDAEKKARESRGKEIYRVVGIRPLDNKNESEEFDSMVNKFGSKYIGKRVVFDSYNEGFSAKDMGLEEDEFEEMENHDGQIAKICGLGIFNDDDFDSCYWNIEFDDGYILDAISGRNLEIISNESNTNILDLTKINEELVGNNFYTRHDQNYQWTTDEVQDWVRRDRRVAAKLARLFTHNNVSGIESLDKFIK